MKKMMKMAMTAAAMFVAVTTVAKAQDAQQQGRGGRRPSVMSILKDSLHVSDAVAAKADSIVKDYSAKQAPLMEAARGGDADARTKMMDLRKQQTDAIKALLTDEQKAQYDKLVPQGGRRGGGTR
jgi:hypothetical protein